MIAEAVFTRAGSAAERIERLLETARTSVDAALYRFNNPRLAQALASASNRGVHVRLVLDRGKHDETPATQELLLNHRFPFRLLRGRRGPDSKMHHKFAILDGEAVLTGSYNWTLESEDLNYENLIVLRESPLLESYRREFEALWHAASEIA